MIQLILGSLALSIIHAMIPNHWIPLVVLSRSEKWSRIETARITAISGFSHTLSTIIIGIIVGLIGFKLSDRYSLVSGLYAPVVLILLGVIYVALNIRDSRKHHHHSHEHLDTEKIKKAENKSKLALILTLSTTMFFSPCAEIEAYYFTAGTLGWHGIFTVSLIYLLVTIIGMMVLVELGLKGMEKLETKFHFLEHNDKLITGLVLLFLGVLAIFVKL